MSIIEKLQKLSDLLDELIELKELKEPTMRKVKIENGTLRTEDGDAIFCPMFKDACEVNCSGFIEALDKDGDIMAVCRWIPKDYTSDCIIGELRRKGTRNEN